MLLAVCLPILDRLLTQFVIIIGEGLELSAFEEGGGWGEQ